MSVAVQLGRPRPTEDWDVLIGTLLHERARQVERVLGSARSGSADVSDLAAVGAARAQQGVPVAEAAHRKAELALALSEEEHRTIFVRGALFGSLPSTELRLQAEAYGLDPGRQYVAVRAGGVSRNGRSGVD
jgi:hypothetical protein